MIHPARPGHPSQSPVPGRQRFCWSAPISSVPASQYDRSLWRAEQITEQAVAVQAVRWTTHFRTMEIFDALATCARSARLALAVAAAAALAATATPAATADSGSIAARACFSARRAYGLCEDEVQRRAHVDQSGPGGQVGAGVGAVAEPGVVGAGGDVGGGPGERLGHLGGVSPGRAPRSTATAPAICGAAADVPEKIAQPSSSVVVSPGSPFGSTGSG